MSYNGTPTHRTIRKPVVPNTTDGSGKLKFTPLHQSVVPRVEGGRVVIEQRVQPKPSPAPVNNGLGQRQIQSPLKKSLVEGWNMIDHLTKLDEYKEMLLVLEGSEGDKLTDRAYQAWLCFRDFDWFIQGVEVDYALQIFKVEFKDWHAGKSFQDKFDERVHIVNSFAFNQEHGKYNYKLLIVNWGIVGESHGDQ